MLVKDQRIQLVADAAFIAQVDEWRRRQPDLPSRSEAIRRLVNRALKTDSKGT
jgi:metal-responsive CopG/Arc/MetJ family transcriptional regulator